MRCLACSGSSDCSGSGRFRGSTSFQKISPLMQWQQQMSTAARFNMETRTAKASQASCYFTAPMKFDTETHDLQHDSSILGY